MPTRDHGSLAQDVRRAGDRVFRALSDETAFDPERLDARDPDTVAALLPLFERIAQSYLRLEVTGREHIPSEPALYVANHNGGLMGPDLFCTLALLWRHHGADAPLYALAHDFAMRRVTHLGRVLQRVGAMRAHPDSARRALAAKASVLVYPGGDLDAYRPFWRRDEVVFGERRGFVRLARELGIPIIPIVAQGAHRSAVIFHEGRWLARALGLDRWSRIERFPLALGLPWIVGAGPWVPYLPLPLRVRIRVLPAIRIAASERARDGQARVVSMMQSALSELAAAP